MIRAGTLEKLRARPIPMVIFVDRFESQTIVRVGEIPVEQGLEQRNLAVLASAKDFIRTGK